MDKKGNIWIILLVFVSLVGVGSAAYFYGKNQTLITKVSNPTATPVYTAMPQNQIYGTNPVATAAPTTKKSTVVFEAEGSFTAAEKTEITKKVVNPLTDYYEMEKTGQTLLTLTISKNTQASKATYPYQAQAVFQGGGNMGFLIMKLGTGVDWWYPECLNGCNLSASYKAKYPEIASKVQ